MSCKKCKGTIFSFKWEIKDRLDLINKLYNHEGYGLQIEDSIITCSSCGTFSEYREEDFIEVIKVGKKEGNYGINS